MLGGESEVDIEQVRRATFAWDSVLTGQSRTVS